MKKTVTKFVCLRDSGTASGRSKKCRRRCKNKNSVLRKKKLKKSYFSRKSNNFNYKPNSEKIMSNWYWSNYKKAVEWQDRHKIAHWKSCALALLEENRYLLQIINSMQPSLLPQVSVTRSFDKGMSHNRAHSNVRTSKNFVFPHQVYGDTGKDDDDVEEDEDDDDDDGCDGGDDDDDAHSEDNEESNGDFEFEMSEEMMKFFEQSYKHKMDLQKLKEKEMMNNTEQEIKKIQTNKLKRTTEMNLLYGEGASMIIGMETAVQLSFDKYCDTKSPKYWPNIPFRL